MFNRQQHIPHISLTNSPITVSRCGASMESHKASAIVLLAFFLCS